ncbi:hypothetical protein BH09BAC1_BH09BAC1_09440 [soil metagenome]
MRSFITCLIYLMALLCFAQPLQAQQHQVTQAEYFWDTDPGQGNGTLMLATDGAFDNALEAVLKSTASLPTPGVHRIGIRVKAGNGVWGPVFTQVIKVESTTTATRNIAITTAEYFWDTDPGQGNGTMLLAFDGNFNQALETAIGAVAAPTVGFHKLGIRVKDGNGWGTVFTTVVSVSPAQSAFVGLSEISLAECFWGNDPGRGNGTPLLAFDGNFDEAMETVSENIPAPGTGMQKFSIRLKDVSGKWGPVFTSVVNVNTTTTLLRDIQLTAAECFWDNDPGQGNGTALLAFNGNFDEALEKAVQQLPTPAVGVHKLSIRMKDASLRWGPTFSAIVEITFNNTVTISPMKITAAEYFWDIDPGQGNGIALLAFNGAFDEALEKAIGTATLPAPGMHNLRIRVKDGDNHWGPIFTSVVEVSKGSTTMLPDFNITAAEFFWDNDPGQGNGTAMLAFNGNFDEALENAMATATLPAVGFHKLRIRVQDAQNHWGPLYGTTVEIVSNTLTTLPSFHLTAAEFYWDTDPGKGNGTPLLAFNGSFDEAMEQAYATASLPAVGFHKLSIRMKDVYNHWGPSFSVTIEISNGSNSIMSPLRITAAEFYWNTDPGMGNGTPMLAFNGNFSKALETALATTSVPATIGFHKLFIRVKDNKNIWGPAFAAVIQVLPITPAAIPAKYVAAAEYFFDYDPGQGDATPMLAFDGNFNTVIEKLKGGQIPTPVVAGRHTLYMRTKDANQGWGPAYGVVVTIDTTIGFHAVINGSINLCPSSMVNAEYRTPAIAGNTYNWSVTGGTIISGLGTRIIRVRWNATGPYQLKLMECTTIGALCDSATLVPIMMPNAASSITRTICQGQSFLGYTASGTYRDTFPAFNGCDSIRTLQLTVLAPIRTTVNQTVCYGQQFLGHTASGTYVDTFAAANSCDSIRTLNLVVRPYLGANISQTICFGGSYLGRTMAGTYRDTLPHPSGCDSIRVLTLMVQSQITSNMSLTLCGGLGYHGHTTTGVFKDTFTAATGCDSIRTLNLTILPKGLSTVTTTVCYGGSFAGYSATGTYRDTFVAANGCDSIRTINLTVRPLNAVTINKAICPNQSYMGYHNSGTYIDTFAGANGCDSIRTLNLTVQLSFNSSITQVLCAGETYFGYTASGMYRDTFAHPSGCDSVRILTLTIRPLVTTNITLTLCSGQSHYGHTTSGVFVDTLTAASGCDSIRTLNLTVLPNSASNITTTICYGDAVAGYRNSGIYRDTFVAANGCDSVRTLNLTVRPLNATSVTQSICAGQSFLGYSSTGIYRDTFAAANGCDSIRTLQLTVLASPRTTVNKTVCFGSTHLGYSQSGTYLDTFAAANGCDSIRTLNLTILGEITTTVNRVACEGEMVEGYGSSGTYIDTLRSGFGCDSIRTLKLTVVPQVLTNNKLRMCPGDSILLGNIWYHTSGIFKDSTMNASGCYDINTTRIELYDEVAKPIIIQTGDTLTVQAGYVSYQWYFNGTILTGQTGLQIVASETGNYTVAVRSSDCGAVSDALEYMHTGVDIVTNEWDIRYYPNPTNGMLYIELTGAQEAKYMLYNSLGQLLYQGTLEGMQTVSVDMSIYAKGVYYLKTELGKEVLTRKVLKIE